MTNPRNIIKNANRLYRVHIVDYPDGAIVHLNNPGTCEPGDWMLMPGWAPPGWEPDVDYVSRQGTTEFRWPSTRRWYRSRSAALRRARLIESYGAKTTIEESEPVQWPRHAPLASQTADENVGPGRTQQEATSDILGRRLAYDIGRSHDDDFELGYLLHIYAEMAGSPVEFTRVLETALRFTANHLIRYLVYRVEHPRATEIDVRDWMADQSQYLWSQSEDAV